MEFQRTYSFSCYSLFYKLLDSLKNAIDKPYIAHHTQEEHMKLVAKELELHFNEKIKNDNIAMIISQKKIEISTRYLNKQFLEQCGVTLNQYLLNYRIIKAMELLLNTNLKIEEIAFQTGFQDSYYFSKFFKQQTGFSPSPFRKINSTQAFDLNYNIKIKKYNVDFCCFCIIRNKFYYFSR